MGGDHQETCMGLPSFNKALCLKPNATFGEQQFSNAHTMTTEELNGLESQSMGTSNNAMSMQDNFKGCPKPPNGVRRLKSRGAILVVTWSYLVTGIYFYVRYVGLRHYNSTIFSITQAVVGPTLPLLGWLADVRFGRYKVIHFSLGMMWISCLLYTLNLVLSEVTYLNHESIVSIALLILMSMGYGGFQANIIQFGTDQLIDASSIEIKSFVAWCSWSFFASKLALHFLFTCAEYTLFAPLLLCCNLTVALVINILFKQVLIKEPPTQNPFKLVYKVIVYAIKNKYPRQRSAFTYCEDGIPSRIDFGKQKYGGPFTTEQVEDVKTLFRVIIVCAIASAIFVFIENRTSLKQEINSLLRNEDTVQNFRDCTSDYIINGMYYICGTILIPLYDLFLRPIFQCCSLNAQSNRKFLAGAIIGMGRLIVYISLILTARHNYMETTNNSTLHCLLHEPPGVLGSYIDYRWIALLKFLNATSDLLILLGILEFFCAQVPYSMKGIMCGICYSLIMLHCVFYNVLEQVFEKSSLTWGTGVISCEFWYFMTVLSLLIVLLIVFIIAIKYYKKRKREDVLPNEQIFAERYYSVYTS